MQIGEVMLPVLRSAVKIQVKKTASKLPKIKKERELPLISFTKNLYDDHHLKDTYLIGVQHIVSSTYVMLQAFLEKGLSKSNLSLIGKCYSTNPSIYQSLVRNGIDVCSSSLVFDSNKAFDSQFKKNIRNFLKNRYSHLAKFKKIIVLDDGGELLSLVNELFVHSECEIIGIEQTTAGFEKVKNINPTFPIINVARSWAKLTHESPFIVRVAIECFLRHFSRLPLKKQPKKILVIGNGAIGSNIYSLMKESYEIEIFDLNQAKSSISLENFTSSLKEFDMIIGCTGKTSISFNQYRYLKKGAILMSLSSSDREFEAHKLRKKLGVPLGCHQDILVDNIYLMNCGFPINFDSNYKAVDIPELQLTRSLLLSAVLQAATHKIDCAGFIPLNETYQQAIVDQYLTITHPSK